MLSLRARICSAALVVLVLVSFVAPALADGCDDCCRGGSCRDAFYDDPGVCCGVQGSRVYCCPGGTVCAQDYYDALCVVNSNGAVGSYAYSYNRNSGGMAAWLIAVICILAFCCLLSLCIGYRRRASFQNWYGQRNGGESVIVAPTGYDRRFSADEARPVGPQYGPPGMPTQAHYAQPTYAAPPPYAQHAAPTSGQLPVGYQKEGY